MLLRHVLQDLDALPAHATLFASMPWSCDSETILLEEAVVDASPQGDNPQVHYLLEVDLCREVIKVWSAWRDGRLPTPEQRCSAVIHYALHDAYEPDS